MGTRDEPTGQDNLLNEWSRPISSYNFGARLPVISEEPIQASGNKLDPLDYYLSASAKQRTTDLSSPSNEDSRQHFYQELALAHLFDSRKQQEEERQSSLFENNIQPLSSQGFDYQFLPNSDLSSSSSSSSSPSNLLDYEQPNYNSKQQLAELLKSDNKKRVFDTSTNQQLLDLATNLNVKYNPKSSLNLAPDQSLLSSSSSSSPEITTLDDQTYQPKSTVNDESQQINVLDENRLVFDNTENARKDHRYDDGPKKLTTLLEDEEVEATTNPNNSSADSKQKTESSSYGNNKLLTASPSETRDKIYYGKVANNDNNTTTGYSLTSMLSGIYKKFANLLSPSSSQVEDKKNEEKTANIVASKRNGNHLSGQSSDEDKSYKITYGNIVADNTSNDKSTISSIFKGLYNKVANYLTISNEQPTSTVQVKEITNNFANGDYKLLSGGADSETSKSTNELAVDSNRLNTKHSVSKSGLNKSTNDVKSDQDNHDLDDDDKSTKMNHDDNQAAAGKESEDEFEKAKSNIGDDENNSLKDNYNKNYTSDGVSNRADNQQATSGTSLRYRNHMGLDNVSPSDTEDSEQRVSLSRRSKSLVLPLKSGDHQLFVQQQTTSPDNLNNDNGRSLSLLGYYAPESRHFRLNPSQFDTTTIQAADSGKGGLNLNGEEQQVYSQLSHRSYSHRLHPGDDVYGSYSELRPIYAAHAGPHETLSLVSPNNKATNDMYFLIMVSAFCVMAIAVVLAAGMFAYRVQQNRKLTTETDYPTYGVVGPNSMNTKCGATGFVGGYFGSIKGSASSSSEHSKNGSAKHLADAYSGSDSGVATSCKQSGGGSKRSLNDQTNNLSNPIGSVNNRSDFLASQNAARMYHYQHQKQQMIISDRSSNGRQTSASDLDSEDENDDGSYTVYECPGLASAHEMEIKNPLFNDDQTP